MNTPWRRSFLGSALLPIVAWCLFGCGGQSARATPDSSPVPFPFPTPAPGIPPQGIFRLGENGLAPQDWQTFDWTEGFITAGDADFTVLVMNEYDPLPDAKDDELVFVAILRTADPAAIPVGQNIALPANDLPLSVMLAAFCFCNSQPVSAGSGQSLLSGTLFLERFSPEEVKGRLELHLSGDIPYFETEEPFYRDLWKVGARLDVSIPEFVAHPRDEP